MRYLVCLGILAGLPAAAAAQHKSTLPKIGGPLPNIGLQPIPVLPNTPWWERQQTPWWERQNPPSWEKGHVPDRVRDERPHHRRGIIGPSVVYVMPAYPYFPFEPEPIVVTRPAPPAPPTVSREEIEREVERIVEERLRERAQPPPAAPIEPAPAPAGSKTLYVIPGCYMGNVSPKEMKLPQGCDLGKLTVITP